MTNKNTQTNKTLSAKDIAHLMDEAIDYVISHISAEEVKLSTEDYSPNTHKDILQKLYLFTERREKG